MRINLKSKINEILEMNSQGKTLDEIASIFGCTPEGIKYQLKKQGVKFNKKIRDFTNEEVELIKSLYQQRKYPTDIAKILGTTQSRISLVMNKLGLDTSSNFFRKEEYNDVIELYKSGLSMEDIASKYGCYKQSVEVLFKRLGVKGRSKQEVKDILYPVNKKCFTDWKDEKTLYFYGLLLSDGCITDSGSVSLALALQDLKTVQEFKDYIGSDNKISISEKSNSCQFSFRDSAVSSNLIAAGLEPRKSTKEKFPLTVDKDDLNSVRHFWRGFICGDGSVRDINNCPSLFICGSLELCTEFKIFCEKVLGFKLNLAVKENSETSGFYYFRISGRKAKEVTLFMFKNQSVCMERKLKDALAMEDWNPKPKHKVYGVYEQKDDSYGVVFFPIGGNRVIAKFQDEQEAIKYRLELEIQHYGYYKSLT